MQQEDIDRVQEFRKCIECFLCQDVCHVLRDHHKHDEFIGPRFLVHVAALEMHPLDTEDRVAELKKAHGIGYCNITKCCTKVCPESITITDNAIIPLKERVVDRYYDPIKKLLRHRAQVGQSSRRRRRRRRRRVGRVIAPASAGLRVVTGVAQDADGVAAAVDALDARVHRQRDDEVRTRR